MTVCKVCGGQISLAYLEKHICPTPNPEYEKERDKYRQSEVERRARNERLGIAEGFWSSDLGLPRETISRLRTIGLSSSPLRGRLGGANIWELNQELSFS
jgi:hypothetical protein